MTKEATTKTPTGEESQKVDVRADNYFMYITVKNRSSKSLRNARVVASSGRYNIRPTTNMEPLSEQYFEMQGLSGTATGCVGSTGYDSYDGGVLAGTILLEYSTPFLGNNEASAINSSLGIKLSLYGLDRKVDWDRVRWPPEGQYPTEPVAWSLLFVIEDAT